MSADTIARAVALYTEARGMGSAHESALNVAAIRLARDSDATVYAARRTLAAQLRAAADTGTRGAVTL